MSDYYWELIQFDGTRLDIPPDAVEVVKRRMASGQTINTKTMSIPSNQIKTFRQTEKRFNSQHLLEEVAQAFKEPLETEDGVQSRWVKRDVMQNKWEKYFAAIPSYRLLSEDNGMASIAYKLPVHLITETVSNCTEDEIAKLERQ